MDIHVILPVYTRYMSVVISIPDRGGDDLWFTAMLESETLPDLLDLISSKYTAWK